MADIELVIKIPRSLYANLSKINHETIAGKRILECVKNGTLLPKGHGDLIDRKKLINDGINKGFCDWYDEIKQAVLIIGADEELK